MSLRIAPLSFTATSTFPVIDTDSPFGPTSFTTTGVSLGAKLFHDNAFEILGKGSSAGGSKIRALTSIAAGVPVTGVGLLLIFGTRCVANAIQLGARIAVGLPLGVGAAAVGALYAFIVRADIAETAKLSFNFADSCIAAAAGVPALLALYAVQIGVSAAEVVAYGAGWTAGAVISLPWAIAGLARDDRY